jgi:AcrR family transcriptional regulator
MTDSTYTHGVTDVTPQGLRERKKARTRLLMERAALELFATRGFAETTIEDIAAVCEVSPRTFFRYFATKHDVLYADSDRRLGALVTDITARAAHLAPFEAVRRSVIAMVDAYLLDVDSLALHSRVLVRNAGAYTESLERQHVGELAVYGALVDAGASAPTTTLELRLIAAAATAALRAATQAWEAGHAAADPDVHQPSLGELIRYTFDRVATGLAT